MMHGRAGAYSSLAKGRYDATTLSKRHQQWGHIWAQQGYLAILVDGFGPRGYPHGFPRYSNDTRPDELNEVTVRPLDAYGALAYLRTRDDVVADRVALQGWSNGGSATLAALSRTAPGINSPTPASGFRAGLVFYPACGLKGQFDDGILPTPRCGCSRARPTQKCRHGAAPNWSRRAVRSGTTFSSTFIRMRPTTSTIQRHRTRTMKRMLRRRRMSSLARPSSWQAC
jgi:dienelactone hydrolase